MLYLLMEDPTANRYTPVNAYMRDGKTGILLPAKEFPRRLWIPDDLIFESARTIPTNILINGRAVDNVLRYLSGAPDNVDGMVISTYDPAKSAAGKLSQDAEATVADVESMLREMRHDPPAQLPKSPPGAEMVRAGYFAFREHAKARLREQETRIFMQE